MGTDQLRSIVVFYDAPCLDGAGAAWCFYKKYGADSNVELSLVPLMHGDLDKRQKTILDSVTSGSEVFFVDTSPKDGELTELLSPAKSGDSEGEPRVKSVTVWDHHVSEQQRMNNFQPPVIEGYTPPALDINIDTQYPSAAQMVWKQLFPEDKAPEILAWIGKTEPPVSLKTDNDYAIAAYIDSKDIKGKEAIVATFDELTQISLEDMVRKGNAISADQHNNTAKMRGTFMYAYLELLPGMGKMWIPVVNANVQNFGRRVNQALLEEGRLGTTVGVSGAWFQQGDGTVKLSIRTDGNPAAHEIASYLGNTVGVSGGGHATDAVVEFKDLLQFAQHVPLYTKEQMREMQWTPPEKQSEFDLSDEHRRKSDPGKNNPGGITPPKPTFG